MGEHKNSVYKQISDDIRAKISSGEYAKGSPIPPERVLMQIYGVERTTVRRAVAVLADDGLIEKRAGLGNFVCDENGVPVHKNEPAEVAAATVKKMPKSKSKADISAKIEVRADLVSAASVVLDRLEKLGHTRIAFVGKSDEAFSAFAGEAVRRGVFDGELVSIFDDKASAEYAFEKMWYGVRRAKPTAVVACDEATAIKIQAFAEKNRISVPSELSIVAVDTTRAEGISGVIFDKTSVKNEVLPMLRCECDEKDFSLCVLATPKFFDGETMATAKNDDRIGGRMSSYLL